MRMHFEMGLFYGLDHSWDVLASCKRLILPFYYFFVVVIIIILDVINVLVILPTPQVIDIT